MAKGKGKKSNMPVVEPKGKEKEKEKEEEEDEEEKTVAEPKATSSKKGLEPNTNHESPTIKGRTKATRDVQKHHW